MLQTAKEREFRPRYVCFEGWYGSLANLKAVRGHGWHFLTRLKQNRLVNPDDMGNVAVKDVDIPAYGRIVHLKGFGFIQVFRTVAKNGDAEHWATDDMKMEDGERGELVRQVFAIENYHRQLNPIKPQAVLRCRASAGAKRIGPEVPHFVVLAGVRAVGSASLADGHQRLRRQSRPHSRGHPSVSQATNHYAGSNCVTPNYIPWYLPMMFGSIMLAFIGLIWGKGSAP